jgi:hypothetical protein
MKYCICISSDINHHQSLNSDNFVLIRLCLAAVFPCYRLAVAFFSHSVEPWHEVYGSIRSEVTNYSHVKTQDATCKKQLPKTQAFILT